VLCCAVLCCAVPCCASVDQGVPSGALCAVVVGLGRVSWRTGREGVGVGDAGTVPGLEEANRNEPLLPWGRYGQNRVVLGARVDEACAGPSKLREALAATGDLPFALTYRRVKGGMCVCVCGGGGYG
jgi:hypothetical protein